MLLLSLVVSSVAVSSVVEVSSVASFSEPHAANTNTNNANITAKNFYVFHCLISPFSYELKYTQMRQLFISWIGISIS